MNRITLDNITYVVSRRRKNKPVELVRVSDGELVFVSAEAIESLEVISHELPSVPNVIPFSERPPEFIKQLQLDRVRILTENIKARKTHKGPSRDGSSTKRDPNAPKKPRKTKAALLLDSAIQSKLAGMSPAAREIFERAMKGKSQ